MAVHVETKEDNVKTGLIPFHLQDRDGSCLSVGGSFGLCNTENLFMYLPKANKKDGHSLVTLLSPPDDSGSSCLSRVSPKGASSALAKGGVCSSSGAKNFELILDKQSGRYFVTANEQKACLVRTAHSSAARKRLADLRKKKNSDVFDSRYLHNGASIQSCKEGGTLLQIVESNHHDTGFWIQASDGTCFDGSKFKACDASLTSLAWGWGFDTSGKTGASRFLYRWYDPSKCLWHDRSGTSFGECSNSKAKDWALTKTGHLSHAKACLVRGQQGDAHMEKCSTTTPEELQLALPIRAAATGVSANGASELRRRG